MSHSLSLGDESDYLIGEKPKESASWSKFAVFTAAVTMVVGGALLVTLPHQEKSLSTPTTLANKRVLKHSIVANKRGYDSLSAHTLNAYSQQLMVEPDVEMILGIPECFENSCGDLTWEITPQEGPRVGTATYDQTVTDTTLSVYFTEANTKFTVSVKDSSGEVLVSTEGVVKYVRREIRTLTEKDRTKFFNALRTVFTVSTEDGKKLYGDRFLGHAHLTALHDYDDYKYHGNLFFLTSHPVMQMKCDLSMIAVDKSVTLAYWDFAQDSHLGLFAQ